jgi:26S proteasome regulatory subunit N1
LRIDQPGLVEKVFEECQEPVIRKQLAFQLGRARYLPDESINSDPELGKIASNSLLSEFYMHLAKEFEAVEPRTPE